VRPPTRGPPKQRRAELHEHVARWLAARPEADDETVGRHLAAASEYRAELGAADHALAGEAAERLAAAADAALLRGDLDAGARLLARAAALLDWHPEARAEVLPALGAALFEAGRAPDAVRVLDEAVADAPDARLRARAQVEREIVRLEIEPAPAHARAVADAALEAIADDDYGQCRLWFLRGQIAWDAGQAGAADAAWERAVAAADRAGARRERFQIIGWRALMAALGPIPNSEAIPRCRDFGAAVAGSPLATASVSTRWRCCMRRRATSRLPTGCSARPARSCASWAASPRACRIWRPQSGSSPGSLLWPRPRCAAISSGSGGRLARHHAGVAGARRRRPGA
jgi:tetratricopeptide (TPR) repeat protein